jgi:hypothetical protein
MTASGRRPDRGWTGVSNGVSEAVGRRVGKSLEAGADAARGTSPPASVSPVFGTREARLQPRAPFPDDEIRD